MVDGGAALAFQGPSDVTLINTTIVGNDGISGYPGGIYTNNDTVIRMTNDTLSHNTCAGGCFNGGGFEGNSGGTMFVRNSIISDNRDLSNGTLSNCAGGGARTSLGNNLLDSPDDDICITAAIGDRFAMELKPKSQI